MAAWRVGSAAFPLNTAVGRCKHRKRSVLEGQASANRQAATWHDAITHRQMRGTHVTEPSLSEEPPDS